MDKYVYTFGNGSAEGREDMKSQLGGKGANLAAMNHLGMPVPPGFTITTEVCNYFYDHDRSYPTSMQAQIDAGIEYIESIAGAKLGDAANPLLVSVRSGARASMPGMMDTILNLGLNDTTVQGLIERSSDARFAYDSYRRFVAMYGDVVLGLKPESREKEDPFEELLDSKKKAAGVKFDSDLSAESLKELVTEYKSLIKNRLGVDFPDDPREQLNGSIRAVFGSWMNDRAKVYRKLNQIPDEWGTAVNIQVMVFGNLGNDCATGVAFTRDPASGEKIFYGEFLVNAQGEDVVAGTRTPQQVMLEASKEWARNHGISEEDRRVRFPSLEEVMPEATKQLLQIADSLEAHYRDMLDVEFTIQNKKLWMLQCRVGKRTGGAAIRIAVEMVEEGLISEDEALLRVEANMLNQLLRPIFDKKELSKHTPVARGLNAGPGAATGRVVFHAVDAVKMAATGDPVILVRIETSPEDISGMEASLGILTQRGGMTSHAALVARQMGRVCVAGCEALEIDYAAETVSVGKKTLKKGDWISLSGATGNIYFEKISTMPSEVIQVLLDKTLSPQEAPAYQLYAKLMNWADSRRRMRVRTNADQPDQCVNAIAFGAEGIGLTRTEHMFFGGDRIDAVREMILADDLAGRLGALKKLKPYQRSDFEGIFRVMHGKPVTIRLLDPPLHEFLPHDQESEEKLAKKLNLDVERVKEKVADLSESNPMLGHRGCRLGIVYPEITEMQAQAIFEAAAAVQKEGLKVMPEVMIPLILTSREFIVQSKVVRRVAEQVMAETGQKLQYLVGTMIELPRAALVADEIAKHAEFFSFGTNDLTQTAMGLSRDDSGRFLPYYVANQILTHDPFESIDKRGVGALVEMGFQRGRSSKPDLKIGICGEHGGDPASVHFFDRVGLDYVSCSPFRVPIARLAAAQATVLASRDKK